MIHGEIKVNDYLIGSWRAVRQESLTHVEQESTYKCHVHWYVPQENFAFEVKHFYNDGADTLLHLVMAKSHEMRIESQNKAKAAHR